MTLTVLMIEGKFEHNNSYVEFCYKPASSDKHKLVVIFTGFASKYDFFNVGKFIKTNVLWVRDYYHGQEAYYLGNDGKFEFEYAIVSLIDEYRNKLFISKSDCILLGGSKGGFASLYFGLKYNYENILAAAFVSKIGTSMQRWKIDTIVMGDIIPNTIDHYNNLLLTVLEKDQNVNKNLYIFYSEQDEYFKLHQQEVLPFFHKYSNYNLIKTESLLAYRHNKITAYNASTILAIINSLIDNIIPSFGYVTNGFSYSSKMREEILNVQQQEKKVIAKFDNIHMQEHLFFMEGCAFIKGYECGGYGYFVKELCFSGPDSYEFKLGTTLNAELTNTYFEQVDCNYTGGGVATIGHKGISLHLLPKNRIYKLFVKLSNKMIELSGAISIQDAFEYNHVIDGIEYRIYKKGQDIYLSKRDVIGYFSKDSLFKLEMSWLKGNRLHIEGIFAVKGVLLENWNDASYYLILRGEFNTYSFKMGMLNKPSLNTMFGNDFAIYQKSYFSTLKREGVDLANILDDRYSVLVTLSYRGEIFSHLLDIYIVCSNKSIFID